MLMTRSETFPLLCQIHCPALCPALTLSGWPEGCIHVLVPTGSCGVQPPGSPVREGGGGHGRAFARSPFLPTARLKAAPSAGPVPLGSGRCPPSPLWVSVFLLPLCPADICVVFFKPSRNHPDVRVLRVGTPLHAGTLGSGHGPAPRSVCGGLRLCLSPCPRMAAPPRRERVGVSFAVLPLSCSRPVGASPCQCSGPSAQKERPPPACSKRVLP